MPRNDFAWILPDAIARRLGKDSYGAQRAIVADAHVLLVLHEPPVKSGGQRENAVFLRTPDRLWSYQGQPDGQVVMGQLLDRYQKAVDQSGRSYEKAHDAQRLFALIERLRPLKRASANALSALQTVRDAVPEDRDVITARDQAAEIARDLELLLADAQLGLSFQLARQAEAQTKAALANHHAQQKLNVLAALTLPAMTVGAVFGMNLHSGLENLGGLWFWAVFLLGLGLGWWVCIWVKRPPTSDSATAEPDRRHRAGTVKPEP